MVDKRDEYFRRMQFEHELIDRVSGNGGVGVHLEDGAFAGVLAASITGNLSGSGHRRRSAISDHSLCGKYRLCSKLSRGRCYRCTATKYEIRFRIDRCKPRSAPIVHYGLSPPRILDRKSTRLNS